MVLKKKKTEKTNKNGHVKCVFQFNIHILLDLEHNRKSR